MCLAISSLWRSHRRFRRFFFFYFVLMFPLASTWYPGTLPCMESVAPLEENLLHSFSRSLSPLFYVTAGAPGEAALGEHAAVQQHSAVHNSLAKFKHQASGDRESQREGGRDEGTAVSAVVVFFLLFHSFTSVAVDGAAACCAVVVKYNKKR